MKRQLFFAFGIVALATQMGCGNEPESAGSGTDTTGDTDTSTHDGGGTDTDSDTDSGKDSDTSIGPSAPQYPELWYSSGQYLVYIELSEDDGSVVKLEASSMEGLPIGQNCLTMLDDGSLVGARLSDADNHTYFYRIKDPPRDGSAAEYDKLGVMPEDIMLEGLYTDCDGRLYGMDTGADVGSFTGNRLLRFLGNYLAGDFDYQVVSDLSSAVVADIDDMGPASTRKATSRTIRVWPSTRASFTILIMCWARAPKWPQVERGVFMPLGARCSRTRSPDSTSCREKRICWSSTLVPTLFRVFWSPARPQRAISMAGQGWQDR
jgi:hypothetical protein